ncbi:MAG: OOP family OmpA-OmpF porin [Cyclobacteriaceae bacterium]|jgi:OOP family OmpA-OmpF porin
MNKLITFLLALCTCTILLAQETIVWGSEVIDVSSEYGRLGYSAIQALHKPNVLPSGGDNPNAWRPKNDNDEQFIIVSFDKPIKPKQVAIAESENPGAVKAVFAYNDQYDEYLLFELQPRALPLESRLLNLFFEDTPYEVYAIKVVLDGEAVPGFNSIDAIGISSSNIPISVLINLVPGINKKVNTENLGADVNSSYAEHNPIISPDGKRLYFSRRFHPDNIGGVDDGEDIWMSELDESTGNWKPAKNIGPPLNTEGPNFISSIAIVGGEEVLILGNRYGKKGLMYAGLSMSKRDGDSYEKPESLEIENDYNYSPKADFFLTPSGTSLITSVERDDSYGGRDLYMSRQIGKMWSEPKNLGGDINTAGEDFAPFLGQDEKTLYYSTNGFSGYGGSDIFVSIRLDDTWEKWSVPENLGSGINSAQDDQYFSIPASGKHIYFSRGDMDEDTDIFRFKADEMFVEGSASPVAASISALIAQRPDEIFITIKGKVIDAKTGQGIDNAMVSIERLPDGLDIGSVKTKESNYELTVRGGSQYGLHATKFGFLTQSVNYDFNKIKISETIEQDLVLTLIEKEAKIVINNIFFDFNKSELKTASYSELNRILESISDGQIKKIQISGHTDAVGSDEYNLTLSKKRANAVFNYFRLKGIPADRMEAIGLGETQPIASNDDKKGQSENRRVEFKILEVN